MSLLLIAAVSASPLCADTTPQKMTASEAAPDKARRQEQSPRRTAGAEEIASGASSPAPAGLPPGFDFVIPKNTCESGTTLQKLRSSLKPRP
jgi:hypothetical protein